MAGLRQGQQVSINQQGGGFGVLLGPATAPGVCNVLLADGSVEPFRRSSLTPQALQKGDLAVIVGVRSRRSGQRVRLADLDPRDADRWRVTQVSEAAGEAGNEAKAARRRLSIRAVHLVRLQDEEPEVAAAKGKKKKKRKLQETDGDAADANVQAKAALSPFEATLQEVLRGVRRPDTFYTSCLRALSELQALVGEEAALRPFGSFAQGTCCEASDLDVALLDDEAEDRHDRASILESISAMVARCPGYRVLREVLTARVPVLRLMRDACGLEIDFSIGGSTCGRGDAVVARALEEIEGAREVVLLVKTWARRRGIRSAFEGLLSSYCWTLLTLYALKRRRARVRPRGSAATPPPSAAGLSSTLVEVFQAVMELDAPQIKSHAVDPLSGSLLPRPETRAQRRNTPLYLRDLVPPWPNASRCLTHGGWRRCQAEVRRALMLCQTETRSAAVALFDEEAMEEQRSGHRRRRSLDGDSSDEEMQRRLGRLHKRARIKTWSEDDTDSS